MKFDTAQQLATALTENGYTQISELLNTTNENLFIGPNNLLDQDKIETAQIYVKPIHNCKELDQIYPDNDYKKWSYSSEINILDSHTTGTPLSNHLVGIFKLGRNLTSHIHIIHGGAIATLIDEYFVKVVLSLTPDHFAVTANLNIKYLKPVKFLENQDKIDVILDCFIIENKDNRKFTVKGSLMDLSGSKYCVGEVLVVVPKEPIV